MGRIPRWPRLAVARGMNKGNCSVLAPLPSLDRAAAAKGPGPNSDSGRSPITDVTIWNLNFTREKKQGPWLD
jgi:hypothetical protein